jgi:hypothetical protein
VPSVSDKQLKEDMAYIPKAEEGWTAYTEDVLYAQYERPEMAAFRVQLDLCEKELEADDLDRTNFDKDVNLLLSLGDELDAVDLALHTRNVI